MVLSVNFGERELGDESLAMCGGRLQHHPNDRSPNYCCSLNSVQAVSGVACNFPDDRSKLRLSFYHLNLNF